MSGIELIGLLFMVALATFVSIVRRHLRGTEQKSTETRKTTASEGIDASVDASEQTRDASRRPTQSHAGIFGKIVSRNLTELVDGLHPGSEESDAAFTVTTPRMEIRSAEHAIPPRPVARPTANDRAPRESAIVTVMPVGVAESYRRALRDRRSIRRAMIMKEVLDRPVAMRGPAGARRRRP